MQKAGTTAAYVLAGALLTTLAGSAASQQPAPRPAAPRPAAPHPAQPATQEAPSVVQNEAPQSTTATYGDWVLQCQTRTEPTPSQVCDMAQVAQVQGKNLPFSRVAIGRPEKGQPIKLIVQAPVNASFATNVHIQIVDGDPGLLAPFATCVPSGCFADFELKEDVLKKIRAASAVGKLSFADAGGHDITVPLSFNGFGQAFDALMKK